MKNKLTQIIFVTIILSFLSFNIVHACLIPAPVIKVKCSNFDNPTVIGSFQYQSNNETSEDYKKRVVAKIIENLHSVSLKCKEDLSPVLEEIEKEINLWLGQKNKRILLDGDLVLEPYSLERQNETQKVRKNLLLCRYEVSQRVGDWLIVSTVSRPYCFTHDEGYCPEIYMSLGSFLLYLLKNLSFKTIPYLAGFLIISSAMVYVWWVVLKKYPALAFWKLLFISNIIVFTVLFLMIPFFGMFSQIIGWVLVFGLIVLWYTQIKPNSI